MRIIGTQLHNRRRDIRVSVMPIEIVLEGEVYTVIDWSLGGFLVEGYPGKLSAGEEILIEIQINFDGAEYHHAARAEVTRTDPCVGQLAANFLALDNSTIATLEGWMTGRLRRKAPHNKTG